MIIIIVVVIVFLLTVFYIVRTRCIKKRENGWEIRKSVSKGTCLKRLPRSEQEGIQRRLEKRMREIEEQNKEQMSSSNNHLISFGNPNHTGRHHIRIGPMHNHAVRQKEENEIPDLQPAIEDTKYDLKAPSVIEDPVQLRSNLLLENDNMKLVSHQ